MPEVMNFRSANGSRDITSGMRLLGLLDRRHKFMLRHHCWYFCRSMSTISASILGEIIGGFCRFFCKERSAYHCPPNCIRPCNMAIRRSIIIMNRTKIHRLIVELICIGSLNHPQEPAFHDSFVDFLLFSIFVISRHSFNRLWFCLWSR